MSARPRDGRVCAKRLERAWRRAHAQLPPDALVALDWMLERGALVARAAAEPAADPTGLLAAAIALRLPPTAYREVFAARALLDAGGWLLRTALGPIDPGAAEQAALPHPRRVDAIWTNVAKTHYGTPDEQPPAWTVAAGSLWRCEATARLYVCAAGSDGRAPRVWVEVS